MAVCTDTMDGVEHTYYFAALGHQVIACIEEISEWDETGELDAETVAGMTSTITPVYEMKMFGRAGVPIGMPTTETDENVSPTDDV